MRGACPGRREGVYAGSGNRAAMHREPDGMDDEGVQERPGGVAVRRFWTWRRPGGFGLAYRAGVGLCDIIRKGEFAGDRSSRGGSSVDGWALSWKWNSVPRKSLQLALLPEV